MEWYQSKGYGVIILGDFNAHTGNEQILGFQNHTHPMNNNGELLISFCREMKLTCLNTISWAGQEPEKPTFGRDYGHGLVQSILDYGLALSDILQRVESSQVHTDQGWKLNTDHATLVLQLYMDRGQSQQAYLNQLKWIKKWEACQELINKRLNNLQDFDSMDTNCQEQCLKNNMITVGFSLTSPARTLKTNMRTLPKGIDNQECTIS